MPLSTSEFNWIDFLALLVAGTSLIYTWRQGISQDKKLKIAEENSAEALRLSQGTIEIQMRNSISSARTNVNNISAQIKQLKLQFPDKELGFDSIFNSNVEDLLNQYDRGCMLYLDSKIDRDRFRLEYSTEIKNLIENRNLNERYFNANDIKYPSIVKVHNQWSKINWQP